MNQPLTKKLALAGIVFSVLLLCGGFMSGASQLLIPMAIVCAGCMVALAIAEQTQR